MKKYIQPFIVLLILMGSSFVAQAQIKKNQDRVSDYSGPIVKQQKPEVGHLGNLFNMQMSQSYSMSFGSVGGHFQNINAYTNTMRFFFTDRLSGRVDLSLLHSPFGNNFLNNQQGGMQAKFIVRNAELDYQISDRSSIHIQFQQLPSYGYGFGMNPWNPFYNGPFRNHNF